MSQNQHGEISDYHSRCQNGIISYPEVVYIKRPSDQRLATRGVHRTPTIVTCQPKALSSRGTG